MNENETNGISTKDNIINEENNNVETQDIDLKALFESGNLEFDGNVLNINPNTDDPEPTHDVEVNRDYVPNGDEDVPPTPEFSDGSDASSDIFDEGNEIRIAAPDYSKLFDTYKQLFENLTDDVDTINNKIARLADILDKNIKETNAAIKATQIYSKLFTKLVFGVDIGLIILIIVLFIIR